MIVMKFGGTSVGDAARVDQVATIIEAQPSPRAAVARLASGVTICCWMRPAPRLSTVGGLVTRLVAAIRARTTTLWPHWRRQERAAAVAALDQLHAASTTALSDVRPRRRAQPAQRGPHPRHRREGDELLLAAMLRSRRCRPCMSGRSRHRHRNRTACPSRPRPQPASWRPRRLRPHLEDGQTVVSPGFIGRAPMARPAHWDVVLRLQRNAPRRARRR